MGALKDFSCTPCGFIVAHDVVDDAALAGGVHRLQDQQDPLGPAEAGLGEELLLQGGQLPVQLGQQLLAVGLVPRIAGRGVRVGRP